MVQPLDISFSESHDIFDWDESEVRDLVRTMPLRYDDDGLPVGYELEQLFGLEATHDE